MLEDVIDELERYLAPLREIDWSGWDAQRAGALEEAPSFWWRRYASIPVEAIPLLNLGVDGCHYAAWIDDTRHIVDSPGVVLVSPTDSYPDAIVWVAPSIDAFAKLLRPDDDFLCRKDPAIARERTRAEQRRAREVVSMTADGMGVVHELAIGAPATPADCESVLTLLRDLLDRDRAHHALVVARNAIASSCCGTKRGFGKVVAEVYRALGQADYADVALASYEPSDELSKQLELLGRMLSNRGFGSKED